MEDTVCRPVSDYLIRRRQPGNIDQFSPPSPVGDPNADRFYSRNEIWEHLTTEITKKQLKPHRPLYTIANALVAVYADNGARPSRVELDPLAKSCCQSSFLFMYV